MSEQNEIKQKISDVQAIHAEELMNKANVVGVGIGNKKTGGVATSELCLVVMVSQKIADDQLAPEDRIPGEIAGVKTDVQEVGTFTAQ